MFVLGLRAKSFEWRITCSTWIRRTSPVHCGSKDTKSIQNPFVGFFLLVSSQYVGTVHTSVVSLSLCSNKLNRHGSESIGRQVFAFIIIAVTVSADDESKSPSATRTNHRNNDEPPQQQQQHPEEELYPTPTGREYDAIDQLAAELPNIIDEESRQQVEDYRQACNNGKGPMVRRESLY
jgi:hypothetical protein